MPGAVDVSLYRTLQESLTNCAKYAAGSSVTVTLRYDVDDVVLTVADDGSSCLAVPGEPGSGGRGLAGIRDRAASLGGSARAGRVVSGGFEVEVRFPI
jgi:signal transduction histidine kinase